MTKIVGTILIFGALAGAAMAVSRAPSVPEIDPASGLSALALISGAVLVIRGRRSA